MAKFSASLERTAKTLGHARSLLKKELQSPISTPLSVKLDMWRRGFLSEAHVIYALDANDPADYLSDYAKFIKARRINGESARILKHKLAFHQVLGAFAELVPPTFAVIDKGRMLPPKQANRPDAGTDPVELVRNEGRIILKPMHGAGGKGIYVVESGDREFSINRKPASIDAIGKLVQGLDDYLAVAFVQQHPALAAIFPEVTNTIRIQTMWDEAPFIAAAVHRIGNARSYPVDNWGQGGFSAPVDLETGLLGRAVPYPANGRLEWLDVHPDTGQPITGVTIPHWQYVKDKVLEICRALPYLKYVGWDIVVTEDGFKILEGNSDTDVNLLQVHHPLLRDRRIRAFYQRHGAV